MARYTVIADAGKAIVDMLKDQIVPEPLAKADTIGICDPKERGPFIVGVHPYDIKETGEMRATTPVTLPNGQLRNPPMGFNINYMVSVVSKAEPAAKGMDESRILGKVIQVMMDNPKIPRKYLSESLRLANQEVSVQMLPMEFEEKVKIWTMFSEPYKLCAFYCVGPIYIDSDIIREPVRRVSTVQLGSKKILRSE